MTARARMPNRRDLSSRGVAIVTPRPVTGSLSPDSTRDGSPIDLEEDFIEGAFPDALPRIPENRMVGVERKGNKRGQGATEGSRAFLDAPAAIPGKDRRRQSGRNRRRFIFRGPGEPRPHANASKSLGSLPRQGEVEPFFPLLHPALPERTGLGLQDPRSSVHRRGVLTNSALWAILDGMPKMALKAARRGLRRHRYAGPGMPPVLGEPRRSTPAGFSDDP